MIRISTGMIYEAGVGSINSQTSLLLHLQQQVATGKRILTPADDPVNAARALVVTQSKDIVEQYATNQNNATSALGLEEAQLTGVNELMGRVRELAVQAGNSTLAPSDRRSVAFELRARFDELMGIANATDGNGEYIFSGFMGDTRPFAATVDQMNAAVTNEVAYQGDNGQRRLQVSPTRLLEVGDAGSDVFKRIRNGNGTFATGYAAANTGSGVIDGGTVTNPTAWNGAANSKNLEVRFWTDVGGGGVNTRGYAVGSLSLGASTTLAAPHNVFALSRDGAAPVNVTVAPGTYASVAALVAGVQAAVDTALGGAGLATVTADAANRLAITSSTAGAASSIALTTSGTSGGLASLFGAATATPGITSQAGETFYDLVDVATGNSLYTNTASTAAAGGTFTHRYVAGTAINVGSSGPAGTVAFDFGAAVAISGTPASGDVFSLKASTSQSVFKTLASLIKTLEQDVTGDVGRARLNNEIGFALTNLDQANQNILRTRTQIGSRLSEIDSLTSVNEDLKLQYDQTLSNLQDLDYAKTISDMQRKQLDLEAAQKSFMKTTQLSLFNYL